MTAKDVFDAAGNGDAQALSALLANYTPLSYINWEGNSPLHAAARKGHVDCVRALVEASTDIDIGNGEGFTPLHLAARNGHMDCAGVLLEAGAQMEARTKRGYTPLHLAALGGHWDCVMCLLLAGADTEAVDMSGRTPLAVASADAVKELLSNPPSLQAAELDFREENEYGAAAGDDIDGEAGADAGTGAGADLHADGEAETEVSPYSPAPSVAEVPEEVARLLASLNLEHFGPALAGPAIGVEWIADLALLRVEDLCSPGRGVGMSVVQARRLLKEAASLEKALMEAAGAAAEPEAVPAVKAAPPQKTLLSGRSAASGASRALGELFPAGPATAAAATAALGAALTVSFVAGRYFARKDSYW